MLSIVKIYHVGQTPTKLLLAGALVLEVAAVFLFARSLLLGDRERELRALCYCAGVWVLFIVMTEFFVAYASEAPFRELLLLTIATAIYVVLIPDLSPTRTAGGNIDSIRIHRPVGQTPHARPARRRRRPAGLRRLTVTALIVGAVALFTGVALAGTSMSLNTAKRAVSGKSQTIVVDGRGVTVYELGGESLAHLQCVTRACFNLWQPLKVPSASTKVGKATGVPGTVGIMRRVRGGFLPGDAQPPPALLLRRRQGARRVDARPGDRQLRRDLARHPGLVTGRARRFRGSAAVSRTREQPSIQTTLHPRVLSKRASSLSDGAPNCHSR